MMKRPNGTRIITDDEIVRRRQCMLLVMLGVVFPVYWLISSLFADRLNFEIIDSVLLLISFALFSLGVFYYCRTRYFVEKNPADDNWFHICPSRDKSTNTVDRHSVPNSVLQQLELIWFPLKYPAKTVIEFQVRSAKQPELVFFTTTSEAKAKKTMNRLAKCLTSNTTDQTWGGPAKNVPKHYLLTKAQQKPASKTTNVLFFLVFVGFCSAFYFAGQSSGEGLVAGLVFLGIAALFPLGWILKLLPQKKPPKKFSRWL